MPRPARLSNCFETIIFRFAKSKARDMVGIRSSRFGSYWVIIIHLCILGFCIILFLNIQNCWAQCVIRTRVSMVLKRAHLLSPWWILEGTMDIIFKQVLDAWLEMQRWADRKHPSPLFKKDIGDYGSSVDFESDGDWNLVMRILHDLSMAWILV